MELASAKPYAALSTRVINGEIWSCDEHGYIVKFDKQLQQKHTATTIFRRFSDIAETNDGDVVLAAPSGLFHMQRNGGRSNINLPLNFASNYINFN